MTNRAFLNELTRGQLLALAVQRGGFRLAAASVLSDQEIKEVLEPMSQEDLQTPWRA